MSAYSRLRTSESAGPSVRRDVLAALIGIAIASFAPAEPLTPMQRVGWGAAGAVGGILVIELLYFVVRYIWVVPAKLHADDQAQIVRLEKKLDEATKPSGFNLSFSAMEDDGHCVVAIHNYGPTDQIKVTSGYALPGGYDTSHLPLRWKGTLDERVHIVHGQHAFLEVFRVVSGTDPEKPAGQRHVIERVELLQAGAQAQSLPVVRYCGGRMMEKLYMSCVVTSVLTGRSATFHVDLFAATDGSVRPHVCFFVKGE